MNGFFQRGLRVGILLLVVLSGSTGIYTGCAGESEEMVRKKLDVICTSDLAAIIDSIAAVDLLEKPYYKLVFYKRYTEGKYSRKAIAEFYFLNKVAVKVVRKYRYLQTVRMWDRYSNEYVFVHDTAGGVVAK
ncbi:MAG: hypothetical protein JW863_09985 [Chitinispirillaceae bacterium]|nr:hypothetical protein [Chitinispirillaceae bacterium]